MPQLLAIIVATVIISLGSLIGLVTLVVNEAKLHRLLLMLVAISAGALMGGAFLHLLPESLAQLPADTALTATLASFIFFYIIENLLFWRHCHDGRCQTHRFGYLNLLGDALHNFLDGLLIAATFIANPQLGVITTVAIALHEIPQEIGDFGVLLYSGFTRSQALAANVAVSLTAVAGGVIGYLLAPTRMSLESYLIPVAAGGFFYIAASDLLPEIRKEKNRRRSMTAFALFLVGIALMALIKQWGLT